jgi:aspartyl-tRNA(Asn)/glutamyl-tRNA(Gln) amidotransferase subunit A
MNDLLKLTAAELYTKLCANEVSSTEVTKIYLDHIKKTDDKVKAYTAVLEEGALAQAAAADKNTKCPPMHGVPIAIKDNISIKGERMTSSSKMLENYTALYDATVIEKLKAAGAVLIGTTNLDEFAMGSSTETSVFGRTNNPWDLSLITGGSSGGSAAAVASGMAPVALGSDTGGSIRQPAAFCGIIGLKPSYGLVSRFGAVALASSLDQIGTFSRTVKDTADLLSIIAGADRRDPICEPNEYIDYSQGLNEASFKGLKVGVFKEDYILLEPEIAKAYTETIQKIKADGAEIIEIEIPSYQYIPAIYQIIMCAEVSANLAKFDGIRYGHRAKNIANLSELFEKSRGEGFGAEVKRRLLFGTFVLSAKNYHPYFEKAQKTRAILIKETEETFKNIDILLMPSTTQMPKKTSKELNTFCDAFSAAANLTGGPAMSIPCGSSGGIPIGMQFSANRFNDALLLRAAAAFEKISGWDKRTFPSVAEEK